MLFRGSGEPIGTIQGPSTVDRAALTEGSGRVEVWLCRLMMRWQSSSVDTLQSVVDDGFEHGSVEKTESEGSDGNARWCGPDRVDTFDCWRSWSSKLKL